MNKYLTILTVFIMAILLSACGEENKKSNTEVAIIKKSINRRAITFPMLPSKNIDVSILENINNN